MTPLKGPATRGFFHGAEPHQRLVIDPEIDELRGEVCSKVNQTYQKTPAKLYA
jgi:hypothetical protein